MAREAKEKIRFLEMSELESPMMKAINPQSNGKTMNNTFRVTPLEEDNPFLQQKELLKMLDSQNNMTKPV